MGLRRPEKPATSRTQRRVADRLLQAYLREPVGSAGALEMLAKVREAHRRGEWEYPVSERFVLARASAADRVGRLHLRDLSAEQLDDIVERYQAGQSYRQITQALGVSMKTVERVLDLREVPRERRRRVDRSRVWQMWQGGATRPEIAVACGCSVKSVYSAIAERAKSEACANE